MNRVARDGDTTPSDAKLPSASQSGEGEHPSALRARLESDSEAQLPNAPGYDEAQTDALPSPGQVIAGKYRIEAQLGRGGMGAVYRATHLISERQVAIKWMLRSAANEQSRQRFLREAKIAARIEHPNVVDVYDIGQDAAAGLYLVMPLLRGETLRAQIARGPRDVVETLRLLLPPMRGVAALHAAGVVHRDLKPDNVFVCEARPGVPSLAKVLDFGISAIDGRETGDPTLTGEGAAMGTPAYMSPEQLSDPRKVDARTDVYAFGVILYEALTGVLPFQADSHNGLVVAIATTDPPHPRTLRPELPAPLAGVILRALAKRRDERFPDMAGLIQALEPFAESAAAGSARPARSSGPATNRDRRSWYFGLGALLTALLLGGVGYAWWLGAQPPIAATTQGARWPVQTESATQRATARAVLLPVRAAANGSAASLPSALPLAVAPAFGGAPQLLAEAGVANVRDGAADTSTKAPASARRLRTTASPAMTIGTDAASAPLLAPPAAAGAAKARSGSISIDDL